jgi:hemoglobin
MLPLLLFVAASAMDAPPGEQPVDPYTHSDANAGAMPFKGHGMWHAFHQQPGVDRIVDEMIDRGIADPVIGDIFKGQDIVRLRRTLKEQFCYILGGGCTYSGRDMAESHKNLGIQAKDMNILVVDLQKAMSAEKVPFRAQMRFLSKLAPMKKDVVQR